MKLNTQLKLMRNTIRLTATIGYFLAQYYYIPVGLLSGIVAGAIVSAIWINREDDPE